MQSWVLNLNLLPKSIKGGFQSIPHNCIDRWDTVSQSFPTLMFVPDSEVLQFQCKKLTSLFAMTEKGKCQGNVIDSHLPTHKPLLDSSISLFWLEYRWLLMGCRVSSLSCSLICCSFLLSDLKSLKPYWWVSSFSLLCWYVAKLCCQIWIPLQPYVIGFLLFHGLLVGCCCVCQIWNPCNLMLLGFFFFMACW
jgi:hypothetical protein